MYGICFFPICQLFHDCRKPVPPSVASNGITRQKMSRCTLFQLSGPKECNDATDDRQCWHHILQMPEKDVLHLISITLNEGVHWCHWWRHQHHMITMPMPKASHDKKRAVPYFDHPDLRTTIVQLVMQFPSCDASAYGGTWPRKSCCTSFQLSCAKECDAAINDAAGITWCWWQCQWCYMTIFNYHDQDQMQCYHPWCLWHQMMMMLAQWHQHTQKSYVPPDFNNRNLTNVMLPLITLLASYDTTIITNGITWPNKLCCTLFEIILN